ncbi:hypothetical protein EXN66_Car018859 [Channa argus]|uniref:Uncharacterized protein n=1 Tax=Channa argus TaxID=215402 RepID=A0A6G1QKG6_CHAAH|nr:hypothetical protein EXN66_Car018859 [Channa argus]
MGLGHYITLPYQKTPSSGLVEEKVFTATEKEKNEQIKTMLHHYGTRKEVMMDAAVVKTVTLLIS